LKGLSQRRGPGPSILRKSTAESLPLPRTRNFRIARLQSLLKIICP
jgi:hypothetical protein